MNVQRRDDVAIYCLSNGTSLPEWLGDRAKRNISKKDESVRRRIELLQDFEFPAASSKLIQSPDSRYILAAGIYPPRIRCYDVQELGMKFERYLNSQVVDMVHLSEDYGKLAILQDDRTVAFHAHYGAHESVRIPTFGRALTYEPTTCEVLVAARNQVVRINLEEGRFVEPWALDGTTATCIDVHPLHPMAGAGCEDAAVRFWDSRAANVKPFLKLDVGAATFGYGYHDEYNRHANDVYSIAFDDSGLYMAAGCGSGVVALYDVRSSRPLFIQEHKLGLPIHTVRFHTSSGLVLSSDEQLIKAWRYKPKSSLVDSSNNSDGGSVGSVLVNIEGNGKLTSFIVAGDEQDPTGNRNGLLLCATDQPKMDSFYVPAIGVAPKWCSYLESITEELEESTSTAEETIFENYKFVSRDDLEKLGVSNLIGTPLLRGYMHGFFMDVNLYNRVKAVANPFEYEEYQKRKLKERLQAKQSSRIATTKATVNSALAERLQVKAQLKAGKNAKSVLEDNRFGKLFTNTDFEIDQEDEDFKLRNPSGVAAANRKKNNLDSDEDDDDSIVDPAAHVDQAEVDNESDDDSISEDDDDSVGGGLIRGEEYESMKELDRQLKRQKQKSRVENVKNPLKRKQMRAVLHEAGDGSDGAKANMTLSQRKAQFEQEIRDKPQIRQPSGVKEVTFVPRSGRKDHKQTEPRGSKRDRRGIKDLGLKKPYQNRK